MNFFEEITTKIKATDEREWLELRKKGIGGSDSSAILGLSPYKTEYELYNEKIANINLDEYKNINSKAKGKILEKNLRDIFKAENVNFNVYTSDYTYFSKKHPFMLANVDGIIEVKKNTSYTIKDYETFENEKIILKENELMGLEIKTAYANKISDWNKIPLYYECQVKHYMAVLELDHFILLAYIKTPLQGYIREYLIKRDLKDEKIIINKEKEFFKRLENKEKPMKKIILDFEY